MIHTASKIQIYILQLWTALNMFSSKNLIYPLVQEHGMKPAQTSGNLALSLSLTIPCSNQIHVPSHSKFQPDIVEQIKCLKQWLQSSIQVSPFSKGAWIYSVQNSNWSSPCFSISREIVTDSLLQKNTSSATKNIFQASPIIFIAGAAGWMEKSRRQGSAYRPLPGLSTHWRYNALQSPCSFPTIRSEQCGHWKKLVSRTGKWKP